MTFVFHQRIVLVTRVRWGVPHSGVSTKAKGVVHHYSSGHLELLHHEDLLVDVGLEDEQPQELELKIFNLIPLSFHEDTSHLSLIYQLYLKDSVQLYRKLFSHT